MTTHEASRPGRLRLVVAGVLIAALAVLPCTARPAPGELATALEEKLPSLAGGERAAALAELATLLRDVDPERAIAYGSEAVELLAAHPAPERAVPLFLVLAIACFHQGDVEAQLAWAERAHAAAEERGDADGRWQALLEIAEVAKQRGQFDAALETLAVARQIVEELDDPAKLSQVLDRLGNTYQRQGDFSHAMESLLQALEIQRSLDDPAALAQVLRDTARVYESIEDYGQALAYNQQALAITERIGDRRASAFNRRNLANVLGYLGRREEALEAYLETLAEAEAVGDEKLAATLLNNIAGRLADLERYQEALSFARRAEPALKAFDNDRYTAVVMATKAGILNQLGDHRQARVAAEESRAAAERSGRRVLLANAHELLADVHEALGDPGRALAHHRIFKEQYDALFSEASQKRLAELQARFDAAEKDRAIADLEHQRELAAAQLVREKTLRNVSIVGSGLFLVLAGSIAAGWRLKRRAQRRLAEQRRLAALVDERQTLVDELEARNQELARFTYTVSHDLKSPLVTIRGFLGFLERDAEAGDLSRMRHDIQRIQTATDRMRRFLDDLLELSRAGRLLNPPESVPLDQAAREAISLVAGGIAERGVDMEIGRDLPVVTGDRLQLVEVFQNLIENAVSYMGDQRAPRIEIGAEVRRVDAATLDAAALDAVALDGVFETVVFVRDNGIGVDPRYHKKIFELFQRLDADTEGTGIGLALVERIVKLHGGRVWVESAGSGQGSTFCFTVPQQSSPPIAA